VVWNRIEREILRVADRLLILGYSDPRLYRLYDTSPDPNEYGRKSIKIGSAYLVYRPGQDGSCEIYDLFVPEEHRRCGIASKMVQELESQIFGSIYGFTREENITAQEFYRSCGFELFSIPRLYRGSGGVMFVKQCLPGGQE
jgi:ribosomal protein S18 acetylase RimI-like enzyme